MKLKSGDVSIPFTSGHVFRLVEGYYGPEATLMSQSLLHQVTYSDYYPPPMKLGEIRMSQSLLHQVTYSDSIYNTAETRKAKCLNPFYIRSRIPTLIFLQGHDFHFPCLNPFYIRSRIPTGGSYGYVGYQRPCLNPFYIRSRIPTKGSDESPVPSPKVSQSLLHQVTYSDIIVLGVLSAGFIMSQSLLHQVTYSDKGNVLRLVFRSRCLNPFYIRSRIPTHPATLEPEWIIRKVSIPFTSGHVFRLVRPQDGRTPRHKCLNPFYIRSRIPTKRGPPREKMFLIMSQSLLHQVTYSDFAAPDTKAEIRQCLNPFYIRSRIPTLAARFLGRNWFRMSQSLLHQVTYSDSREARGTPGPGRGVSIPFTSGHVFRPSCWSS